MEKDFDSWNKIKRNIESNSKAPFFYERELWWCSIGENVGSEISGKHENFERPALILKVLNKQNAIILPLTTKARINPKHYLLFHAKIRSAVILQQIRFVSGKRLIRKIGMIGNEEFDQIKVLVKNLL